MCGEYHSQMPSEPIESARANNTDAILLRERRNTTPRSCSSEPHLHEYLSARLDLLPYTPCQGLPDFFPFDLRALSNLEVFDVMSSLEQTRVRNSVHFWLS